MPQPPRTVETSLPVRHYPDHGVFQGQTVHCDCGWRGLGRQAERGRLYDIGVEVLCPACTRRIGVALFAAPAEARPSAPALRPGGSRRSRESLPAGLRRMLDLFEALSADEHERAQVLLASNLPLTRAGWVHAFFCGHDPDSLPAEIEAHLPPPFRR